MSTFLLPATLTLQQVPEVLRSIQAAVATSDGVFTLDARDLQQMDTSVVALAIEAQRLIRARGGSFELRNPPAKLLDLARLYGVNSLLAI